MPFAGITSDGWLAIAERRDAWEIWSTADSVTIGRLILVSLLVDAVFILAYGWMLWLAIRRTSAPRTIRWVLLTTLLALEVVEAMLLADWASHLIGGGTVPEWITWASTIASTAKWVAGKLGMKGLRQTLVTDLDVNISLGTYYMKHVLELLDNQPVLASAGYNAKPGQPHADWPSSTTSQRARRRAQRPPPPRAAS